MDYSILGTQPISDNQPAGGDVRYEDDFELLQAEIDKLASVTGRDSFSWSKVVELASKILKEKSKDILAASYLCVGLVHINGAEGLSQAAAIYDGLLANFWDDLFPPQKRIKARVSAIEWWIERTGAAIENGLQLNIEPAGLEETVERLARIQDFLEKNQDLDISAAELINKVKALESAVSRDKKKENQVSDGRYSGIEEDIFDDAGISGLNDALKRFNPVFQKFRLASRIIREDKAHAPQSYKWLRFALWEPVKAAPAAVDGVTKLPPPSAQTTAHLQTLKDEEQWEELLLASESALNNPKHIFLLDLNRFSAEALLNQGQKYETAHDAVCHETYLFKKRLSGMEDLFFSDGVTPFADGETKQWLKSLESENFSEEDSRADAAVFEGQGNVAETIKEAGKKARGRRGMAEAAGFLQDKINCAPSRKEAFLLRLELVRLLVSGKKEKAAVPHLELIWHDFNKFRLDIWEPELALDGLKKIYRVFKKQSSTKYKQKAEEVFNMIAGLSTVDAMKL